MLTRPRRVQSDVTGPLNRVGHDSQQVVRQVAHVRANSFSKDAIFFLIMFNNILNNNLIVSDNNNSNIVSFHYVFI